MESKLFQIYGLTKQDEIRTEDIMRAEQNYNRDIAREEDLYQRDIEREDILSAQGREQKLFDMYNERDYNRSLWLEQNDINYKQQREIRADDRSWEKYMFDLKERSALNQGFTETTSLGDGRYEITNFLTGESRIIEGAEYRRIASEQRQKEVNYYGGAEAALEAAGEYTGNSDIRDKFMGIAGAL